MSPDVAFCALGTVAAVGPHGATAPLPSPRQRALLAALLLRIGRPVPTTRLIDEVWGDDLPAQPGPALHTLVTRLRSYLAGAGLGPDLVVTDPVGYALAADPATLDTQRFDELRRQAASSDDPDVAVTALGQALDLWGDPYPGVEFEAARLEAIRLQEARVACVESRAAAMLASGRPSEALETIEPLVTDHPLRETAREVLIRGLYVAGRQVDALDQYESYRRLLADELGLEPSARLTDLQVAVLRQEVPDGARAPLATAGPARSPGGGAPTAAEEEAMAGAALGGLRVRFAPGPTGSIAFATAGAGPLLLTLPAWISSIDVIASGRDPRSSLLARLARHYSVVLYDRAGTGLSRAATPQGDLDTAVAEAMAVIAQVGRPVHVLAVSQAGPVAIRLAAEHPDVVSRIALMGTYANGPDTFTNVGMRESVVGLMRAHWGLGSRALAGLYRPASSTVATDHMARVLRDSAAGPVAADLLDAVYEVDVTEQLRHVQQPVLVLHYRGDRLIPFQGGHHLVSNLPNAQLVALDGSWHLPDVSDLDRIEGAIVEHLGPG